MDKFQITRLNNANKLLKERCGDSNRKFSEIIARQESYVHEILKGKRAIGRKIARHIEASFNLQPDELDRDPLSANRSLVAVPILEPSQIRPWINKKDINLTENKTIYFDGLFLTPQTYAIIAEDSSMSPRICAGDIVFLAIDQPPKAGDIIALDLSGKMDIVTLGELSIRAGARILKYLEGGEREIPIDFEGMFLGTLRAHIFISDT